MSQRGEGKGDRKDRPVEEYVKFYLTDDQVSCLLLMRDRCTLLTVRSIQSTE
jgi:hypothetical protein